MAEYIDRKQLLELINEDCKYQNPTNEYTRGCNEVCDWAIKTIKNIPTADVVPKSEVDKDIKVLTKEVAKQKAMLLDAIDTFRNLLCIESFVDYEDTRKHYVVNIDDVDRIHAELKKKYTEEKT